MLDVEMNVHSYTKQFHKIVMKRLRISNASDVVAVLFGRDGDSGRRGIGVEHMSFLIFQRILDGCVQIRRLRSLKKNILAKANLPTFFFLKLVFFWPRQSIKRKCRREERSLSATIKQIFIHAGKRVNYYDTIVARFSK